MSNRVYLLDNSGTMKEMVPLLYESEDILQKLVADYSQLLAGEQISPENPRRWLLVSREISLKDDEQGTNRWSLDHLSLDQETVSTLVEIKRSRDTRIRREVVGQMLDYAANAVLYWPVDKIVEAFEKTCESRGIEPGIALDRVLEGSTPDEYWAAMKTNLQAGRIRLIFVEDEIPREFKRIVEFLNQQMDPAEVLAIEVNRYTGEDYTAIVPILLGNTLESQSRKQAGTRITKQRDQDSFRAEIMAKWGEKPARIIDACGDWATNNGMRFYWGRGIRDGSFMPVWDVGEYEYYPFIFWTYGRVEIQFQYLKDRPAFKDLESRRQLSARLHEAIGIEIQDAALEKRPSFPLEVLAESGKLEASLGVFTRIKETIYS